MMGKTHFAVGLATALVFVQPTAWDECLIAVIGGVTGGVLADCDILDHNGQVKAFSGQLAAAAVVLFAVLADRHFSLGIARAVLEAPTRAAVGGIAYAVLWLRGVFSGHRTFTHSILAMLLYTVAVGLIHPPMAGAFFAAYASHLVLDLMNKKNLPVFYPVKSGFSLRLCYADGYVNRLLFSLGCLCSGIFLVIGILNSL